MLGALQGWPSYGSLPTRVQALCWSRPHPGRRQSQYSWAHMDPSAHSLAFRGGAEVPRPVIATLKSDASRVGTYRRSLYGRGRMLCNLQVRAIYVVNPEHGG